MNLKQTIVEESTKLFRTQGFAATSMRQIATASACTNAALYHYFPEGKKHILRAVIRQSAKQAIDTVQLAESDSLESLLAQLYVRFGERMAQTSSNLSWLMVHIDTLPDEERHLLQDQVIGFQREMQRQFSFHVSDPDEAHRLTWLICCAFFGYRQLFSQLAIGEREELTPEEFGKFLIGIIGKATTS